MNNLPERFVNQKHHVITLSAVARTTIIHPDGTSDSQEKSLEQVTERHIHGDSWMINHFVPDRDLPEDHKRRDYSCTIAKETISHTDKNGTITKKESAVKKEDNKESLGIKCIGIGPDSLTDQRNQLIDAFSSGADPFSLLIDNHQTPRQITSSDDGE